MSNKLSCKYSGICGCKNSCVLIDKLNEFSPRISLNFVGSTPPDSFVGRYNYPNVFAGILAPPVHESNSERLGSPEQWFKERLSIEELLAIRSSMVYSRFPSNVKKLHGKLLDVMQETSLACKPCDVEFLLKKKPFFSLKFDNKVAPVGNPAPLIKAKIQDNPKVPRKVDYIVSDTGLKAEEALFELYKNEIPVSYMIKLLSSGLLGVKMQRTLVPTRFSVTAVDSIISNNLIKEIKDYPWINDIQLFHDEYLGNHYEILLLPRQWSFEVIELTKKFGNVACWQDYEDYYGRKSYASSVTGAYYSNRIAVIEYLTKIKRQASALVLREISDIYWFPMGVWALREVTRSALSKKQKVFSNLKEAFDDINTRLQLPLESFIEKSVLIRNYKQQSDLKQFI